MIKIFIGTYEVPAGGRWYDLSDEDEKEAAEFKIASLNDAGKEYLISDVESEFDLKKEQNLNYYLEMQELFESLEEDDLKKAFGLLKEQHTYYADADELHNLLDNCTLYYDGMRQVAEEQLDMMVECNCTISDSKQRKDFLSWISCYLDYEKYERDMKINGYFVEFEYEGQDYVLEIH